jgi:hypothetical protein
MSRDAGRRHAASSLTRKARGGWRRSAAPLWLVGLLVLACAVTLTPTLVQAQTVAGCLLSGPEEYWPDMWLDTGAARLYIADWTNARILVHDTRSLSKLGEISLTSYLPNRPYKLAGHQATGTLYAIVCDGGWSCDNKVIAINTHTLTVDPTFSLEHKRSILVDEQGHRLLALGGPGFDEILTVVDVSSGTHLAEINLSDLMETSGHIAMATTLNPVTGEALFFQGGVRDENNDFVVVNGRTLQTERIFAPDAYGLWIEPGCATWNWLENKLYITTGNWDGYFIHDRKTGQSSVTSCWNDGTKLFFSPATNRVYSGAEINWETTVIEGASDGCQNFGRLWGDTVGFVEAKRRAYFVGSGVTALDEDSLSLRKFFPSCIPPSDEYRAFIDEGVTVDQAAGRVFARIWEGDDDHMYDNPGPAPDYTCILVIDDTWPKRPVHRHLGASAP